MDLHKSQEDKKRPFLFLDSEERVAELPTNFLNFLSLAPKNRARGTLSLYATHLRDFCRFLESHPVYGQVRIDDALRAIGLPIIDEYYRSLTAAGLQPPTIRGHEVVVKMFTDWLTTESAGRIHGRSLYENVAYRTARPSKRMPRYLVAAEVIQLCKGMHWEYQRLVTHFMYDTGARVSEIPRVLKSDLPRAEAYPANQSYFPLLIRGSKGRGGQIKERFTIISRPMLARMNRYFTSRTYFKAHAWSENEKPAFLNLYGEPITSKAIQKLIATAARRVRLERASAHRLRHGAAFSVMRSDHGKNLLDNLVLLQRILGHSTIATTEIYTNIPAPVLQGINTAADAPDIRCRIDEAAFIFDETYLPEKKQPRIWRIGKPKTA